MRQALEEITSMLLQDTSTGQHHQQSTHKQHRQGSPSYRQQQQQPHTVNVPVTISMTGEGGRGAADSQPESPGSPLKDPSGESAGGIRRAGVSSSRQKLAAMDSKHQQLYAVACFPPSEAVCPIFLPSCLQVLCAC